MDAWRAARAVNLDGSRTTVRPGARPRRYGVSAGECGRSWLRSRSAPRSVTRRWPTRSAAPIACARSERRWFGLRSQSKVPCHRVIGANGDLTGYGGGLQRKRALLDLEAAVAEASRRRRSGRAGQLAMIEARHVSSPRPPRISLQETTSRPPITMVLMPTFWGDGRTGDRMWNAGRARPWGAPAGGTRMIAPFTGRARASGFPGHVSRRFSLPHRSHLSPSPSGDPAGTVPASDVQEQATACTDHR